MIIRIAGVCKRICRKFTILREEETCPCVGGFFLIFPE